VRAFAVGEKNCGWKLHRLTRHNIATFRGRGREQNRPRLVIVHRPPGKKE
jgi:hypothetical protein